MTTSTTYRAAYWVSDDGQADVRLTGPDQATLSDAELIAAAEAELTAQGGDVSGGEIVIGEYTG